MTAYKFPVQIQADNEQADSSLCPCLCHVFDTAGLVTVFNALTDKYQHVIAWDADGEIVQEYDNR